jgi:hypothetical protein
MDETKGRKPSSRDLSPAPEDAQLSERLHALERQLEEMRPPPEVDRSQTIASGRTAITMALRVGAKFAAGVIVDAATHGTVEGEKWPGGRLTPEPPLVGLRRAS